MNILYIFNKPIIPRDGGVERVTDNLSREFVKRGHNVYFLCYTHESEISDSTISCPQYYLSLTNIDSAQKQYYTLLETFKIHYIINQILSKESFSLLHITPSNIKIVSVCHILPFSGQCYIRKKYHLWRPESIRGKIFKYINLLCPKIAQVYYNKHESPIYLDAIHLSDRLCFISKRFFPRIIKQIPQIDISKLVAINNPNTFDNSNSIINKDNIILFVGRASNIQKNVPAFIRVWHKLSQSNPQWKAFVIGDGPDIEYNKSYTEHLKVERLYFLGNQSNVAEFYSRAKFICVTSFGEAWGMVITEAMNYGCVPCVFDTYESLHDIIDDGINGLIIPPFKEKLMVDHLQYFISHPNQWEILSKNAIRSVQQFSVKTIADQWEHLLKEISR